MARYRTKNLPVWYTVIAKRDFNEYDYLYWRTPPVWSEPTPRSQSYTLTSKGIEGLYESMLDAGDKWTRIPKPVKHVKVRGRSVSIPSFETGKETKPPYAPIMVTFNGPIFPPESIGSCVPSYSQVDLTGMSKMAFQAFHEQLPEATSLPNFLLELGDLKDLLPTIEKWRSLIKLAQDVKMRFRPGKSDAFSKVQTIGDVMRVLRNQHLQMQFGVVPLLSDLKAFANVIPNVRKRLAYLRKTNGKRRRVHFSKPIEVPLEDIPHSSEYIGLGMYFIGEPIACNCTFHASAEVVMTLEGLDEADTMLRGVADALGFSNPAKVIWNAIPFSFVLEYFVKIEHILNGLKVPAFQGKTEVFNVCHSISATVAIQQKILYNGLFFGTGSIQDIDLGSTAVKLYERKLGLPVGYSDLPLTDPSPQQQVLMAALLDQKVRK